MIWIGIFIGGIVGYILARKDRREAIGRWMDGWIK